MTISNNLYAAVLSMDAYNRVQDAGVDDFAFEVSGTALGNATRITSAQLPTGYNDIGFFATAWTLNGETIIAFRGTDFGADFGDLAQDIFAGWVSGSGTYGPQTAAAELFYETVTGRDVFDAPLQNVVLTGHSLGGGLAGYVASLSNAANDNVVQQGFIDAA